MITGAIAVLLLVVVLPAAAHDGNWGTFWITIGIAAVVLFFGLVSRADDRATVNRMNYWSMSGKDRARARHQWEAEARREEERERQKQLEKMRRREVRKARKQVVSPTAQRCGRVRCAKCGLITKEVSRPSYGNATFILYECPYCGNREFVNQKEKMNG